MIRNGTTLPGRSPAHQEVVGALDQACAIWGLAGGDGRSRFIQHCLRYGLLSLLDAGVRDISEAAEPEFEINYWDGRAWKLAQQEAAGKQVKLPSFQARRRADDLRDRLRSRNRELDLEAQIDALPPVVVGGAIVVPQG